jgi:phosphoglucomutase
MVKRILILETEKNILKNLSSHDISKKELAGEKIESILTQAPGNNASIGGLKVTTKNGWFAARPSGTENIYKIYAESFRGTDHLRRILEEAQSIVNDALKISSAAPISSEVNE